MEFFIARQPILDKKQRVYVYELLYRDNIKKNTSGIVAKIDGDKATTSVVTNSLLYIGLETLTEGKKAFINFTEKLLIQELPTIMNKKNIIIEILENVTLNQELIMSCINLKRKGYTLALDDFNLSLEKKFEPILSIVDIIKVDFMNTSYHERKEICEKYKKGGKILLAEKVETKEDFNQAVDLGYTLFQGYFFSKPVIMKGKGIEGYKNNYIQVFNELSSNEPEYKKIAEIIKRDVSITYELLKLANSFQYTVAYRINSVEQAIVRLGIKNLKALINLIMIKDMGKDKPDIIFETVLFRGKMAEMIAEKINETDRKSEFFLLGLFSLIDVIMDQPLDITIKKLPLEDDIKDALLGYENIFKQVYDLIIFYEKGQFEDLFYRSQKLEIDMDVVTSIYIEANIWVKEIIKTFNSLLNK